MVVAFEDKLEQPNPRPSTPAQPMPTNSDSEDSEHFGGISDAEHSPPSYTTFPADEDEEEDNLPPSNFLEISDTLNPIEGKWKINTSLRIPQYLLTPVEDGQRRPNLLLKATNMVSIDAEIILAGGEDRVYVKSLSEMGPITLKVRHTNDQKVFIDCTTERRVSSGPSQGIAYASHHNSPIHIFLPRTFSGPVTIKQEQPLSRNWNITHQGSLTIPKLSRGITSNLTTFYQRNGERKCFLGALARSGFGEVKDAESWTGDELLIRSTNGMINISYVDEDASQNGQSALPFTPYPYPTYPNHVHGRNILNSLVSHSNGSTFHYQYNQETQSVPATSSRPYSAVPPLCYGI